MKSLTEYIILEAFSNKISKDKIRKKIESALQKGGKPDSNKTKRNFSSNVVLNKEAASVELGIIGKDWLEKNGFDCSEENLKSKKKAPTTSRKGPVRNAQIIKYYEGLYDFISSGLNDKKFTINDLVSAAYDTAQNVAKADWLDPDKVLKLVDPEKLFDIYDPDNEHIMSKIKENPANVIDYLKDDKNSLTYKERQEIKAVWSDPEYSEIFKKKVYNNIDKWLKKKPSYSLAIDMFLKDEKETGYIIYNGKEESLSEVFSLHPSKLMYKGGNYDLKIYDALRSSYNEAMNSWLKTFKTDQERLKALKRLSTVEITSTKSEKDSSSSGVYGSSFVTGEYEDFKVTINILDSDPYVLDIPRVCVGVYTYIG